MNKERETIYMLASFSPLQMDLVAKHTGIERLNK